VQLADTSAWVWSRAVGGQLRAHFDHALVDGTVVTCAMVRVELLYSARNTHEFVDLRAELSALSDLPIDQAQWDRAVEASAQLAHQGRMHHRSVK
jgi:predicted nucleic acid-binding protein